MPLESYVLRVAVLDANNNNKSLCLLFTSINIMIQNVNACSLMEQNTVLYYALFWAGHISYRLVFFLAFFQRYFHWQQSFEAVSAQHLTIEQSKKAMTINNICMYQVCKYRIIFFYVALNVISNNIFQYNRVHFQWCNNPFWYVLLLQEAICMVGGHIVVSLFFLCKNFFFASAMLSLSLSML